MSSIERWECPEHGRVGGAFELIAMGRPPRCGVNGCGREMAVVIVPAIEAAKETP